MADRRPRGRIALHRRRWREHQCLIRLGYRRQHWHGLACFTFWPAGVPGLHPSAAGLADAGAGAGRHLWPDGSIQDARQQREASAP